MMVIVKLSTLRSAGNDCMPSFIVYKTVLNCRGLFSCFLSSFSFPRPSTLSYVTHAAHRAVEDRVSAADVFTARWALQRKAAEGSKVKLLSSRCFMLSRGKSRVSGHGMSKLRI